MKALINRSSLLGTILFITTVLLSSAAYAQDSDLSIAKVDTPDPVIAGTELTYTITVNNAGPDEAAATTVVDTLPAGTTYVSDNASFDCTPDTPEAGKVSCLVGVIAAGGSPSFDIVVAVSADVPHDTVLSNEATVSSSSQDPDDTNNTVVGVETTVNRESDLSIAKVDDPDPVVAGTNLTYTITVDNAGPSDAAVTTVVDTLPTGTTYVSDTAGFGCTADTPEAGKVSCLVGKVVPSGSPSFDLVVAVDPGVPHGTTITNLATVSSSSLDPALEDNIVSEPTLVNREATFDITKIWEDQGAGEVEVTLTCSDGTVTSPTSTPASMTVTGFGDGTTCSVTEAVPAGYAPSYSADCNVTGVSSGSTYSCEVTNAETVARFHVTKEFSDGSADAAEVTLTCDTGLPLTQSLTIAGGDLAGVTFVVTDYVDGTMSCSVTEVTNTPGYDPDTTGCVWDNLMTADSPFSCVVNNTAQDATFTANMEWNFSGDGGGDVPVDSVLVTITCNNAITGGQSCGADCSSISKVLGDGGSLVAKVDTTARSAVCSASQASLPSSVERTDDCGLRTITAGQSDSCLFVNTVFFEGIPTLNQYGLAILALLMLGVGFVGFRRFV